MNDIKNTAKTITIGILAHVDAGKTTLSEAILYKTGELRKPGRVDHGNAFLDDNYIEKNRGITIFSRQARFSIKSIPRTNVTLIDTPGHVDFAAEMERSLSVIDYALLVVSGSEGVQAHTRTLYRMLSDRNIPVFIFVNKMDIAVRQKSDILEELSKELGAGAVSFETVLTGTLDAEKAGSPGGFPERFIDAVTLYSPELAEKVLEDEMPCDEDIAQAIIRREIVPCVFGSALKMTGIENLLEVIGRFSREKEYGEDFAAKVYKITKADDGERLCFIKITGGELKVRDTVYAKRSDGAEWEGKVNQIRFYSGSRFMAADSASAGSVCAVTGLAEALTGDALGAEIPDDSQTVKPFMVYKISLPEGADPYPVMKDLMILAEEDPALNIRWRPGTEEIEIRLMGQVQLEVLETLIRDRFGYDISFETGRVLYLETISDTYEGVGHFEPLRHFAEVHLIIEPGERESGIVITSITPEDELARNWQRLIMTHIEEKEHAGVLTGAPLTDVRISLAAGRAHDKHTSGGDFREATYRAVRNALMQARSDGAAVLLEPWYEYEIELPASNVGRAMTDIRQMGGTQDELEQDEDRARLRGRVPASEIAGYQQILTGYTSGSGKLACTPAGYEQCHDQEKIIAESGYDPERDVENSADSVFVSHGSTGIVRWDEVPEHMHIGSVLRRMTSEDNQNSQYSGSRDYSSAMGGGDKRFAAPSDPREEAKRRTAAEKELKAIFERTYGSSKKKSPGSKSEKRYGNSKKPAIRPELMSAEDALDAARNAARNEEIRAKHLHKTAPASDEPPVLIIDGYNLIYADRYLKELSVKDMGSARDQMLERICNYSGYLGWETTVVFDAYNVPSGTGREEELNGIKIIYTAKDEPADIRMGLITGEIKNRRIYVVSSDSLVQQDAWGHGALRISSREFMDLLDKTEQEIRSRL